MSEASLTMRAETIQSRDGALHVSSWGESGPPLLLLHGIGSRGLSWLPVVAELSREFQVVAPDLRGHGDSSKPGVGYRLADYADDLEDLLDALTIDLPLILGHSLGGLVAWEWARRHPRQAARIVIEDSPLRPTGEDSARFDDWLELARLTPAEATARFRVEHANWTEEECERRAVSITSTDPAVFIESRAENQAANHRLTRIAAIESPMLLIHGDPASGGLVSDADAAAFVAASQKGSAFKIPGGSHALHRDSTAAFLAAALPFLRASAG